MLFGQKSTDPDPAHGTELVEEGRQPRVDLVRRRAAQVVGADQHEAVREPLHREDFGLQPRGCLENALPGDRPVHDRDPEEALGNRRPGVAVVVVPRHVIADVTGHIALRDAVSKRDHRDAARTLHVDGVDCRGLHERGASGGILRGHRTARPGVAVGECVDVARGHRAIDVEGNVQLVPEGDGEGDRIAGHALSRIAREAGRAVEVDCDGRGRELALGPGQRDGGGVYRQRPVACLEADPQARAAATDGDPRAVGGPGGGAHRHLERLVESGLEHDLGLHG